MELECQLTAFEDYLRTVADRSANTVSAYLGDLRLFARWYEQTNGELLTPQRLTRSDAQQYRQHLQTVQKRSTATINRKLAALRAYVAWAREADLIEHNPINGVRGLRQQSHAPRWLEKTEQHAFVREVEAAFGAARSAPAKWQARRDHALVLLMLHAGLRVGEACALQLDDIQRSPARRGKRKLEHWTVKRLRSFLETSRSAVAIVAGKGAKQREVPLNAEVRRALATWLAARKEWLKALQAESSMLFIGQYGEPFGTRGAQFRVKEYGRRANLGVAVTPHVLRHTCVKRLLEAGVGEFTVAAIVGHESLDTTRRYGEPSQQEQQEAVERLAD